MKIDIENFFPSIKIDRVAGVFSGFGLAEIDIKVFSLVATVEQALPQGAPTSPSLSNLAFLHVDNRLEGLATEAGLKYSRYADDLFFSGERLHWSFRDIVELILKENSFKINADKSRLMSGGRKIVTGISISSGTLKLPRATRRKWKNDHHIFVRRGSVPRSVGHNVDPFLADRLLGRIDFWRSLEPESDWLTKARKELVDLIEVPQAVADRLASQ